MPEAIGLVCCTVHQVYILPEDSADSEHHVYLQMTFRSRAAENSEALALGTPSSKSCLRHRCAHLASRMQRIGHFQPHCLGRHLLILVSHQSVT